MSNTENKIKLGDYVVYVGNYYPGVSGTVIQQYFPTACEQQTMIRCIDGKVFHAPTRLFRRIEK